MPIHSDLSYAFHMETVGGRTGTHVVATCAQCRWQQKFPWRSTNNPARITTRFQREGWQFDAYQANYNLCPVCNPHHNPVSADAVENRGVIARRLRHKRAGANIGHSVLARRLLDQGLVSHFTTNGLSRAISKIERGEQVSREHDILTAAAAFFNTNPAWQCGEGDEPDHVEPEPPKALPIFHISITDAASAKRQLVVLQADLEALQGLTDEANAMALEASAMAVQCKELIIETSGKVDAVTSVIEALQQAEIERQAAALPALLPEVTTILTNVPDGHDAVLNGVVNGSSHVVVDATPDTIRLNEARGVCTWVSNSVIDRTAQTKQNVFAKLINNKRFNGRTITLTDIISELKTTISTVLLPENSKPKEYVRRMMIREAIAPNGVLVLVAPGAWRLREDIAATGIAD